MLQLAGSFSASQMRESNRLSLVRNLAKLGDLRLPYLDLHTNETNENTYLNKIQYLRTLLWNSAYVMISPESCFSSSVKIVFRIGEFQTYLAKKERVR